ncbi:polyprenyl synthetase family protein [Nocardia brasiliensis]|uniref:polyprenyl synthetase family protein n=1 Tax=Nocardia brasiliensis TaxID=37326 RepID=UPI00378A2E64
MTTTIKHVGHDEPEVLLARARRLCDPVIQAGVAGLPEPLRRMAGYHFGWCDAVGAPRQELSGKALRPALTLGTAAACGGDRTVAVSPAVAVELIHNFTLIHDDVIDRDATRRARATVWAVWGIPDAILLGDALHALAIKILSTGLPGVAAMAAIDRIEATVIELCRGQHQDCAFETRTTVGIDDYLTMAMGKTGALMGCACALGALGAGAAPDQVAVMDRFGRELGVAFQCVDDYLGIWGDPATTAKPVGSDIARCKRSLPVVAALEWGGAAARELASLYRSDTDMTAVEVARAVRLIESTGAKDTALQHAEQRLHAALDLLPDTVEAGELTALAYLATRRNR